jgi:predicted dehydrogenase
MNSFLEFEVLKQREKREPAMNVAFYGAGRRAQPYLQALARRPDMTLAGVCDLDRRAAEITAAGWGAKVYLTYEALLQEGRPDALWICTAPHLQADVIARAAELHIPFFVEPPGALDYDRARIHGRQITKSKLVTAVGFTSRYADIVLEAREYLGANPVPLALGWWLGAGFGQLLHEEADPAPDPGQLAGRATQLLWSEACRLIDALRVFCGEVNRVRALAASAGTTEGGLVVQLEFASGSVGVLTCAAFARPEPRVELEFMGDGWSLNFGEGFSTLRVAERDKTTMLRCLNNPAAEHVTAFLAAVETADPSAVAADYSDALRTLSVCHAAVLSVREASPVAVADPGSSASPPLALAERISQPQGKTESDT